MSLSDRFDLLEKKRVIVKPVFNTGASQRRDDLDSRRRVGRQTQFDARRQGVTNVKPVMRAVQAKTFAPRQQQSRQNGQNGHMLNRGQGRGFRASGGRTGRGMPPRGNMSQNVDGRGGRASGRGSGRGAGRTNGRGNAGGRSDRGGRGGRGGGGRGGGRGGRGTDSALSKKPDLDEGLDEYWFKAGKGPDPKVLSLDRSMDKYWSKTETSKTDGDAAAAADDKMTDAAQPAAETNGVDPEL